MFTIIEEADSCPVAVEKCEEEAEQKKGVKTANYARDSNKNVNFLEMDSCAKKDIVSDGMNAVESSPMVLPELNRRSRRCAVVKDTDADYEEPAILSDTGHVQLRGRSRRGAVVKDSDDDDEDPAILSDTGHVQLRGRSRRGAVKDTDDDDEDPAILSDNGRMQCSKESVLFQEHFYQKTKDLESSIMGVRSFNYARSQSYPSSKLCESMPNLRSHDPLSRTTSMDSVRLNEWLTSYTDKVTLSNTSLPTLPRQAFSLQDEIKSHKQSSSSLPSHIQRAFPELTTPPTRPKSPLVLHELRSPSLSRQNSVQSQEEEELSSYASADAAILTRYSSCFSGHAWKDWLFQTKMYSC